MKIKITGANGYIGRKLLEHLQAKGHSVSGIGRKTLYNSEEIIADQITGSDAIINLAGAPILQRWNNHNKSVIYNSRVLTTKKLCGAINSLPKDQQPKTFISASAIAIYHPNLQHDENSNSLSSSFSGKVVMDWEDASLDLNENVRRVIFRLGVVLGKNSLIMKKMIPTFKMGIGGTLGDGKQPFPFIHIDDALNAFEGAIDNENYKGIFNLVAPEQISNQKFVQSLAKELNRPAFFKVPTFSIKALWGEASEILLATPHVIPDRLTKLGFPFKFPTIEKTFQEINA